MTRDEAVSLAAEAIKAGIFNDLGSGSNVDICVIPQEGPSQLLRNYERPNERGQKERNYRFPKGTTAYLNQKIISKEDMKKYVVVEEVSGDRDLAMDVDS